MMMCAAPPKAPMYIRGRMVNWLSNCHSRSSCHTMYDSSSSVSPTGTISVRRGRLNSSVSSKGGTRERVFLHVKRESGSYF